MLRGMTEYMSNTVVKPLYYSLALQPATCYSDEAQAPE